MSWQIDFKIVNIYTAERQLNAPKILDKTSALTKNAFLLYNLSLNTQSCIRRPLCSIIKSENFSGMVACFDPLKNQKLKIKWKIKIDKSNF